MVNVRFVQNNILKSSVGIIYMESFLFCMCEDNSTLEYLVKKLGGGYYMGTRTRIKILLWRQVLFPHQKHLFNVVYEIGIQYILLLLVFVSMRSRRF